MGISTQEAYTKYIEIAEQLPTYGITFFKVTVSTIRSHCGLILWFLIRTLMETERQLKPCFLELLRKGFILFNTLLRYLLLNPLRMLTHITGIQRSFSFFSIKGVGGDSRRKRWLQRSKDSKNFGKGSAKGSS